MVNEVKKLLVTIDGPAASGKTSVSREIANRLGWNWVSTGAFYRGIAFLALKFKVGLSDEHALVDLVGEKNWKVFMSPERTQFILDDEDVTDQIYLEEIGSAASKISHHPRLRESLLQA